VNLRRSGPIGGTGEDHDPVDGEIGETTHETDPADAPDRVTPEQLIGYLRKAHFDGTRGRRGYQQGEVNAFLLRLAEAVAEGEPLAALVRRQRFTQVRLEHGYEIREVDEFLAAVVDLDPHAHARPSLRRSSLVTKLFG
jgi:DivIVA domain-containing protein